ncbi:hypothetical protein EV715DRAFT_198101 [Schizophyllum commune]
MDEQRTKVTALLDRASCLASIELQRAGFVPSQEEREELARISSRLHDALRIFELHGDAPAALRQRAATQVALNRSISSPVRRLPPELLLIVIYFIIEEVEHFSRATLLADTIASVCVRWRYIALGEPRLWSYISSVRPYIVHLDLTLQVLLAASLPLHIEHPPLYDPLALVEYFRELEPYSSRWEALDVSATWTILESMQTIDLPLLTSAKIGLEGPTEYRELRPFEFLSSASALKHFVVYLVQDWPDNASWDDVRFPSFPSLLTFELHMLSDPGIPLSLQWLYALESSRCSLLVLHLQIQTLNIQPDPRPPIRFTSLRQMVLLLDAPGAVLRHIVVPALEELTFRGLPGLEDFSPIPCLANFVSGQPLCNLKRLSLADVDHGDPLALVACLQALGSLEELRVREASGNMFFLLAPLALERLICVEDQLPLLPRLSTIKVTYHADTDTYRRVEGIWLEMVASRTEPRVCENVPVVALREVGVKCRDSNDPDEDF